MSEERDLNKTLHFEWWSYTDLYNFMRSNYYLEPSDKDKMRMPYVSLVQTLPENKRGKNNKGAWVAKGAETALKLFNQALKMKNRHNNRTADVDRIIIEMEEFGGQREKTFNFKQAFVEVEKKLIQLTVQSDKDEAFRSLNVVKKYLAAPKMQASNDEDDEDDEDEDEEDYDDDDDDDDEEEETKPTARAESKK